MNRFSQVTALASVRLGGTRLFLSGGEETLIRVHQVQIFLCKYLFGGNIFYGTIPETICMSQYLKHKRKQKKCKKKLLYPQMTSKSSLKEVAVLRGHLSNIRSLTVLPLSAGSLRKISTPNDLTKKNEEEPFSPESMQEISKETTEALVISGGGRAELRLWHLALQNGRRLTIRVKTTTTLT